ncbi:hypothetical protein KFL_001190185 [Klebsormidium nitens]|uniref:Uncharacterized protein n=1 Tax=Klebsormidium nitens TaxID=105231 RepID=A0A0U9HJK5_KLENI|nr:hypothetical protein KFL_001190185 [Klebsormidium nitens]|eukprot:GAQ82676.1 hypothetical protein KFL_001190185 [Klebsormidium nitens]
MSDAMLLDTRTVTALRAPPVTTTPSSCCQVNAAGVELFDEIAVDLDVLARADLPHFPGIQMSGRGASIIYATQFLDGVDKWATHIRTVEKELRADLALVKAARKHQKEDADKRPTVGVFASKFHCRCFEPASSKRAAAFAATNGNSLPAGRDAREEKRAELTAAGAADGTAGSDLPKGAECSIAPVQDAQATHMSEKEYLGEYGDSVTLFPAPDLDEKKIAKHGARVEEPSEEARFVGARIAQ